MAKRRRTRQDKIIAQLRRQLEQQPAVLPHQATKIQISQEAILPRQPQTKAVANNDVFPDNTDLSLQSRLIKKDLLKTLIVSLAIVSLEIVLYWKLR
jgi:hypothetical protein